MDPELITIIKSQTQVTDSIEIERVYYECKGDLASTILKLANVDYNKPLAKPITKFDHFRTILDEKATVFQNREK